ncbi:MAG: HEAT repeat domain-containing protein [Actinobacteria bacterium]|nr:HEAT repeat domain-containing protein [Actinomycetota bacterium]
MVQPLPKRIAEALTADDSGSLDEVIRERNPEDLKVLRSVARNPGEEYKPHEQRKALYALGRWADPSLVADIGGVLPTLDAPRRIAAIDALGRLGGVQAAEAVARHAEDDSPQVRKFVVKSLRRIDMGNARAVLGRMAAEGGEERWLRELAREELNLLVTRDRQRPVRGPGVPSVD